jgi:hypothetical protein
LEFDSEEMQAEHDEYLAEKASLGGKHPDDGVCLIVRFDACKFTHYDGGYSSSGPALIMNPCRHEVERFVRELRKEYAAPPPREPEEDEPSENGD